MDVNQYNSVVQTLKNKAAARKRLESSMNIVVELAKDGHTGEAQHALDTCASTIAVTWNSGGQIRWLNEDRRFQRVLAKAVTTFDFEALHDGLLLDINMAYTVKLNEVVLS